MDAGLRDPSGPVNDPLAHGAIRAMVDQARQERTSRSEAVHLSVAFLVSPATNCIYGRVFGSDGGADA